jgi:hypothetical protein
MWLVSPTGNDFTNVCPFSVSFPTASLSIYETDNPDGGANLLVVTPMGGTYPAGAPLAGTEDPQNPGNFVASSTTPNETECGVSQQTSHIIHFTFTSATLVTGTWTKTYNGCTDPSCTDCNCVAGGSTKGAFNGVKQ